MMCMNCKRPETVKFWNVNNLSYKSWRNIIWCNECKEQAEKDLREMDEQNLPHAYFTFKEIAG